MHTIISALLLLSINLGLLWLLMAAPLGARKITVQRRLNAEPRRIWDAIHLTGDMARWHPWILSSEAVGGTPNLVRQSFSHPDRKGRPITRVFEILKSGDTAAQTFEYDARVVEDSALDVKFWRNFREHRQVTPTATGAELTIEQTDRYRGIAFLVFRYFSLRREVRALESFIDTGQAKKGGMFEHPLTQAGLAVLSTLMLWPFLGFDRNGLVISTILTTVIVLHELGHLVAYRTFGHKKVRMIFVPLLGGIAIGGKPYNSLFEVATCALMGSGLSAFFVPIVIAVHDSAGDGLLPAGAAKLSLVFLLVLGAFNLLNLLPMNRFDGGQVLRQIFPGRAMQVTGSFLITVVILWVGWRIGAPTVALLAGLAVFTLMSLIGSGAGRTIRPREALDAIAPGERLMAGFGLYAAVTIHAYAVIFACDRLFG